MISQVSEPVFDYFDQMAPLGWTRGGAIDDNTLSQQHPTETSHEQHLHHRRPDRHLL